MEEVVSTPVKEVPQTSVFKEVTINDIPEVTILERQASEGGDEGILEGPLISEEYEEGLDAPNEEDSDDEDVSYLEVLLCVYDLFLMDCLSLL